MEVGTDDHTGVLIGGILGALLLCCCCCWLCLLCLWRRRRRRTEEDAAKVVEVRFDLESTRTSVTGVELDLAGLDRPSQRPAPPPRPPPDAWLLAPTLHTDVSLDLTSKRAIIPTEIIPGLATSTESIPQMVLGTSSIQEMVSVEEFILEDFI